MSHSKPPTEPMSWNEAPSSLKSALEAARGDLPSEAELADLARSFTPGGSLPPGAPSGAAAGGGILVPIIAAIVAGGIVVAGALAWKRVHHAPPLPAAAIPIPSASATSPAEETVPPEPSAAVVIDADAEAESSAVKARPAPRAPSDAPKPAPAASETRDEEAPPAAPVVAESKKISEAKLLDQARVALRSDPKRALQLADEHRRRFPHGLLAEEREVIAMQAMKRLGMTDAAKSRAKDFRSQHPESVHAPNVDEAAGD